MSVAVVFRNSMRDMGTTPIQGQEKQLADITTDIVCDLNSSLLELPPFA
jgi:hypothetical protein